MGPSGGIMPDNKEPKADFSDVEGVDGSPAGSKEFEVKQ